jgi:KDO2-lipid IV(A) lauroyltransferase
MPDRKVNVARVVERDKPAEAMLRDLMTNDRLRAVDLNEGPIASMKLLAALRGNEIVAIQGDRVYQGFSAELPFFGAPASFPLGPFFLAYITGAPVLPGFVVRKGWLRYRVIMSDPIELPQTGDRERDLEAGLRQAVRFLEENVRKYHDQWLNFFEFWPAAAHNEGPATVEPQRAGQRMIANERDI